MPTDNGYHTPLDILQRMMLIRSFESRVNELFAAGELKGTSHLAVGMEASAVGAAAALNADDYFASNHRGHGHFIAKNGEPRRIMAEIFGKETGYSQGRGGTQHMADFSLGFLGMNGITAGMLAIATGAAFSARYRGSKQVALAFFGDGASNQGTFHESLNLAAIWKLPAIYLCENNMYAMSTPASDMVSVENIAERAASYHIPGVIVDGTDVEAVRDAVSEAAARARRGEGPTLIEAKVYRFLGHSRGDLCLYRSREEEAEWANRDPICNYRDILHASAECNEAKFAQLQNEVDQLIIEAEQFARESNYLPE